MKIGILKCDYVSPEKSHIDGDYCDMFLNFLFEPNPHFQPTIFEVQKGEFPKNTNDFDAFLCSGSQHAVYDSLDWIQDLKQFVREVRENGQKYVGVCFGHQIIAESLGGKVHKTDRGWGVGIKEVRVKNSQAWMNPDLKSYNLIVSHQDQVEELPVDGVSIAGNEHCPHAMIGVDQQFLGIQGHPEFSVEYAKSLLLGRKGRIPDVLIESALESYSQNIHRPQLREWIESFLLKK